MSKKNNNQINLSEKVKPSPEDIYEMLNELGYDGFEEYDDDYIMLPEKVFFEDEPVCAYHLRIKLKDSPIPIWREIEVPSNISLEFFAHVAIESMGWANTHLHEFSYRNKLYYNREYIEEYVAMDPDIYSKYMIIATEECSIAKIFEYKGDRIKFTYDFGDNWRHEIWLKGIREYNKDEEPSLKILKGKGDCPPDDCGGIFGYTDILRILNKKHKTAEDKETLDWCNFDYYHDPNEFEIEFTKERLYELWEVAKQNK